MPDMFSIARQKDAATQIDAENLLAEISAASQQILDAAKGPQIIEGTGGKTVGMLMQEQQANLQAQTVAQSIAADTDWAGVASRSGKAIAELSLQQAKLNDKIIKDSSVSLWDDPLTAIANAFTLPWDQQALDSVNQKLQNTTAVANAANNHVQQSAVTADKIKTSITAENLEEQAAALKSYQDQQYALARINKAKLGLDGINQIRRMNGEALDLYIKELGVRNQEEARQRARKEHDANMKILDRRLGEVKDADQAEAVRLSLVNSALTADGKPAWDKARLDIQMKSFPTEVNDLISKGFAIEANGSNGYSYGDTIQDRMKYINDRGIRDFTPQGMSLLQMQANAEKGVPPEIIDKKERLAAANRQFSTNFNAAQSNIKEGSAFAAPAYSVYADDPVSRNPIWQKYIAPTINEGNAKNSLSPEVVRGAISQAIQDRTVTPEQAAAFGAEIFRKSIAYNNVANKVMRITGMEQTVYGYSVSTYGPSGTDFMATRQSVNLADATSWKLLMARDLARKIYKETRTANVLGGGVPTEDTNPNKVQYNPTAIRSWLGLPSVK